MNFESEKKYLSLIVNIGKELLKVQSASEVQNILKTLISFLPLTSDEEFSVWYKNVLLYSTKAFEDLPLENLQNLSFIESVRLDNIILYHKNLSHNTKELLYALLPSFSLAMGNIELREKLNQTIEELKKLDEYRINFVRSISHELKTPLSIILGNAQLIKMNVFGDATHLKEPVQAIEDAAKQSGELINNLLELSRVETGRVIVKSELIHVKSFEKLINQYKFLANGKGLQFDFQFSGAETFSCDYKIITTIISNLLSNAIKYTDTGFVRGELNVLSNSVVIRISDSGKGISQEQMKHIFDPFFGERTTLSTGLGLAIVKKFVDFLNGKFHVESNLGKGTTFEVIIPRLLRPTIIERKEHIQVLLVHPDKNLEKIIRRSVEENNLKVARNGAEAYALALEHTPDVVVTSLGLPDVSGDELILMLKKEPTLANTKFFVYTGGRSQLRNVEEFDVVKDTFKLLFKLSSIFGKDITLLTTKKAYEIISNSKDKLQQFCGNSKCSLVLLDEPFKIPQSEMIVVTVAHDEIDEIEQIISKVLMISNNIIVAAIVNERGDFDWYE
ncbi:MAG: hybrid sensor histidine kinase/response regulator [Fervidobacterium sp.]